MVWKFVGKETDQGYPGLGWQDYDDAEMAAFVKEYEPLFKASHGPVSKFPLWKHVADGVSEKGDE